jgi:hypothetical protein
LISLLKGLGLAINPGEVEASCVFRALMRYEVKQLPLVA